MILYYLMIFVLTLVMLNLLIAIMNQAMSKIQEDGEVEAKRERYRMMDALDKRFRAQLDKWRGRHDSSRPSFPQYLVIHLPAEMDEAKGGAGGVSQRRGR